MSRIFIVDDHEMVRRGLTEILSEPPEFEVIGEAASCREATGRIAATRPDVAIVDVHLPDGSGIDLCRHIRQEYPDVRVLVLTAFDDEEAVLASVLDWNEPTLRRIHDDFTEIRAALGARG